MNILELDEAQGLTIEMLHSWLLSHGWRLAACEQGCGKELVSPSNRRCNVLRSLEDFPWSWALIETRMSTQALLREINPRMRKGMPSQEAITAHGGTWMATPPLGRNGIIFVYLRVLLDPSWAEWSFWPCDRHGNKVRWPTDAEGKML